MLECCACNVQKSLMGLLHVDYSPVLLRISGSVSKIR